MKNLFKRITPSAYILTIIALVLIIIGLHTKLNNTLDTPALHDCYICKHPVELTQVNDSYCVECSVFKGGCGLTTGYSHSKQKVVKEWNAIVNAE